MQLKPKLQPVEPYKTFEHFELLDAATVTDRNKGCIHKTDPAAPPQTAEQIQA
jgi:hypothetical protein